MPSKGIQAYTYISVPGAEVEYSVPGTHLVRNQLNTWFNDHFEVDKKRIGGLHFTGNFQFTVKVNGNQIVNEHVGVNSLTGNLEGGTMNAMAQQTSIINGDVIVCYSFYDAGTGVAGLPNAHQCNVTVTTNNSNWMGKVAPLGSHQAGQKFSKLVIPAAHDIGMNSMQTPDALLQHAGGTFLQTLTTVEKTFATAVAKLSSDIALKVAPNIISSLSITQKDTVQTILELGARYFEFRPAHIFDKIKPFTELPDKLYFMHGPIPGMLYDDFLHQVVPFLQANPAEIVVIHLRWDGVPKECAHPSDQELSDALNGALAPTNGTIHAGNLDDLLNGTIDGLRQQGRRLIVLPPTNCYSTYTDGGYATLNGDSIIAEFERLSPQAVAGHPFTNIQCQATASNIKDVVINSVLDSNTSNSCLLATKGICDNKTLRWIRDHAMQKLPPDHLTVVMNDFFDGATADVAIGLSRQRLG